MEIKGGGVEEGRGVGTVMVWKKRKQHHHLTKMMEVVKRIFFKSMDFVT